MHYNSCLCFSLLLVYIMHTHLYLDRPAVCLFYLILRALDTIEDDMTIQPEQKAMLLKSFHTHLYEPEWNFTQSQEKDKAVLEEFPKVADQTVNILVCLLCKDIL